jgi:transposase
MPKSRPPYPPEYRRKIVALVRAGRSPNELASEFECSAQTVRNWVAQAQADTGQRDDMLTTTEREELRKLRRENKQLKLEREILAKATAWFARETNSIPDKDSNS